MIEYLLTVQSRALQIIETVQTLNLKNLESYLINNESFEIRKIRKIKPFGTSNIHKVLDKICWYFCKSLICKIVLDFNFSKFLESILTTPKVLKVMTWKLKGVFAKNKSGSGRNDNWITKSTKLSYTIFREGELVQSQFSAREPRVPCGDQLISDSLHKTIKLEIKVFLLYS